MTNTRRRSNNPRRSGIADVVEGPVHAGCPALKGPVAFADEQDAAVEAQDDLLYTGFCQSYPFVFHLCPATPDKFFIELMQGEFILFGFGGILR